MEMAGKTAGIGRNQPELAGTDRTLLDLARSRRTGAVREEQQRRPRPDLGRPEQLKECGGAARTGTEQLSSESRQADRREGGGDDGGGRSSTRF